MFYEDYISWGCKSKCTAEPLIIGGFTKWSYYYPIIRLMVVLLPDLCNLTNTDRVIIRPYSSRKQGVISCDIGIYV